MAKYCTYPFELKMFEDGVIEIWHKKTKLGIATYVKNQRKLAVKILNDSLEVKIVNKDVQRLQLKKEDFNIEDAIQIVAGIPRGQKRRPCHYTSDILFSGKREILTSATYRDVVDFDTFWDPVFTWQEFENFEIFGSETDPTKNEKIIEMYKNGSL